MSEETTNPNGVYISHEQLQKLMTAAIAAGRAPGVLEQQEIEKKVGMEKRRAALGLELGYAEESRRYNQQNNCSHSRDKASGQEVAKGSGAWMTSGQVLSDGNLFLLCLRCQTSWRWVGTHAEMDYASNAGLLGYPPPDIQRCINKQDFLRTRPVAPVAVGV